MIIVRFPDPESERKALGFLAGRFTFTTQANGDTLLPEAALPFLAAEGIKFNVEGLARHEQRVPAVRNPAAA